MEQSLKWYQTRKFWAIVYGVIFLFSTVLYFFTFLHATDNFKEFYSYSLATLGATTFYLLVLQNSFTLQVGIILESIYLLILIFLIYSTFKARKVSVLFPLIFLTLFLISALLNVLLVLSAG